MDKKVIVYCDESGNTGPNYLDSQQPFYVLAGWSIPCEKLPDVAAVVEKTRQAHCPSEELKSTTLLRRPDGVKAAMEMLRQLGRLHCVPIYVAAEKRFCVAGKIVETFMDPMFNDRVENPFIPDVITKQQIANLLYDYLPTDIFDGFANAYRRPTGKAFRQSLAEIAKAVDWGINAELAASLQGCLPYLDEIARLEADVSILGKAQQTLNLPALTSFLMMIEMLGRWGLINVKKIVHDEQAQYEEGYKKIFEMHRNAGEGFYALPNDAKLVCPLKHIGGFEIAESDKNPLLPAADILAGVVRSVFCKANSDGTPTENEVHLSEFVLPALLISDPKVGWLIASNQLLKKLGKAYFCHYGTKTLVDSKPDKVQRVEPVAATVFPLIRHTEDAVELPEGTKKLDLPLYTLVGKNCGAPMFVRLPDGEVPANTENGFLLLFSSRNTAVEWLGSYEEGELTEDHKVESFGPDKFRDLIQILEVAQQFTSTILIDPGPEGGLWDLPRFVRDLRRIYDRMVRIFSDGFGKEICHWHEISGKQVCSVLGSDGRYGASIPPNGKVYFGNTREEAIENLISSKEL
ncbi:MAG: DUF3800 domain-containing protein [Phycisphaerae bacterium]|nr:DUF3800 domain-containing protein [Phycisphaerae bacterium]